MPTVTVQPEGASVVLRDDETILDGLFRCGYAYRIGCRRGGCGVCMVDLVAGEVRYNRPVAEKVLSEADKAAGSCLTCRAVPVTAVTIALRAESLRMVNPMLARLSAPKTG